MKKILITLASLLLLVIISITIYWNLPIEITRKSDSETGNTIIKNIEAYQKANGKLPGNNDWKTLKKLGFNLESSVSYLSYTTDNHGNFELAYLEGFEGPYLLWNSKERKWTIDQPKIYK
ncbi:hypothetical protein [Chryseobacterium taiwanense]|uniref:Uncharacterized protein n=1 Tax=Chryseobacterium taiwanense TaxID=363331 RepID=A0A0B4D4P5_9FLAO|nr:hypothetical protein [Chryseobacterium taiwanense]KIC63647.1 hypothetical protein RM51_08295 [Chryseobacterium taiwanense]